MYAQHLFVRYYQAMLTIPELAAFDLTSLQHAHLLGIAPWGLEQFRTVYPETCQARAGIRSRAFQTKRRTWQTQQPTVTSAYSLSGKATAWFG